MIKNIFNTVESPNLSALIKRNAFLVDVRTPEEFADGHIIGSVNIPLAIIEFNLQKFKDRKDIIVFCRSGNRSGQAKKILEINGISGVVNGGAIDDVKNFI
ncbi:MAG: rhodanese-like domain-containing protein [Saprospiraceae bacterium]|nr:rhodanese-like domain-containing protein [Saprospiraceae bacterium]